MDIVVQTICYGDSTIGRMSCGDLHCFTLELPWLGNEQSVSCIPEGKYTVELIDSPSNGMCLAIQGVEGRTHIQIHSGNYTRQIRGCMLVGDSIKYLDGDDIPDVTNSRNTLSKLLKEFGSRGTISISRAYAPGVVE